MIKIYIELNQTWSHMVKYVNSVSTIKQNPRPVELPPEIQQYTQEFLSFAKASTENTISMCELLNRAKVEFRDKEQNNKNKLFNMLCESIGYPKGANDPTIKKYVRIGESAERFKPYIDRLPNSWTTLYEITQLDSNTFDEAIENGTINIKMIGRDVKSLKPNATKATKKLADKSKKPVIQITLGTDERASIDALFKELEVLKFSYKLEINPNDIAKTILNNG